MDIERTHPLADRSTTRADDLVTVSLASLLVTGVYVDGWAHNTHPSLETFFTPWHALLYSGFAGVAAWIAAVVVRRHLHGNPWRGAIPAGYGVSVLGVGLFLVAGVGDLLWHLAFGIEHDIEALLSPTHLGLFAGAVMIATGPLLATIHRVPETSPRLMVIFPGVLSATLVGCLTAFILQNYAQFAHNGFVSKGQRAITDSFPTPGNLLFDRTVEAGVAAFMIGSVTLFVPLLLILRTWQMSAATPFIVISVQVIALQALRGFDDPGLTLLGVVGAALVAALVAILRPGPDRVWRSRITLSAGPIIVWGVFLAGVGLHDGGLGWPPEAWGGALVWSGFVMLGIAALGLPGPAHVRVSPAPRIEPR